MLAPVINMILVAVFPLAMAYAAISDLLTMTIPNKVAIALVVAFLALAPATGMGWQAFIMHAAAGVLVLVIAFGLFAAGWIGGGDAKFCAAVALWIGWGTALVEYLVAASVFGGALTLLVLSYRQAVLPAFVTRQPWLLRLHDAKAGVPYGVALAAAGIFTYPDSIWMKVVTG